MGTIHKHTHRPLALVALFILLGAVGWHLPQLGRAVMAYSNHAIKSIGAARENVKSVLAETTSALQLAKAAVATTAVQQTPGQQAVSQARSALDAARAAARSNPGKASEQNVDTANANLNAAITLRLSEIRTRLNQLTPNSGAAASNSESGPAGSPGAEYATLVAELQSLGGFPNAVNAPAPNQISETEPNNTSATANTLNVATVGIATGAVTPLGDLDFFKFTAPASSRVWIYVDTGGTLVTGTRDSFIDLLGTDGSTVIEADDDDGTSNGGDGTVETGFGSAVAGRSITTAGDYFIRVRGFGVFPGTSVVNPYKLFVVVTTSATTTVAESEPNDTAATADVLLSGATTTAIATGSVASGATDFYSVTVDAGDLLYVNLDGDPERDGMGTDVELSLRDSAGVLIGSLISDSINLGSATDPPAENFSFLFTTGGTFTLRVFGFGGQGSYHLMAALSTPAGGMQVCPPIPITSSLGVAGGNFPKVSGTMTQRLFRDGVQSVCGVPRTQVAPIAGTFTFDKYTLTNSAVTTKCITVQLRVIEQAASNYMVGAFSAFVPTNLTSGWLGDPGLSSGIPPGVRSFSVNIAGGASFDLVVFNTNPTGNGNPYELTVVGFDGCVVPPCMLTCPANITVSNTANQCGAVVNYPAPTTSGVCLTVTCAPASGSFFPVGTTTVTCTGTSPGNPNSSCTFTVRVNDTQPPAITCPANQFAGTSGATAVVNYPAPTASDNCPGIGAPVCSPASGSAFPVGVTTVTCTVADAAGNTATCSFTVTVNRVVAAAITDPLDCTGPGNVVTSGFTVTNNGTVMQTVTVGVAMPVAPAGDPLLPPGAPLLVLIPGSCTANAGTCTVVSSRLINFTVTLAPGASATASYRAQVSDLVTTGRVLTVTTTASFNGGPLATATSSITVTCAAVGPGAPFPARSEISDQKAGSVLIYPIYTSSVGQNSQNSRINITNTHPSLNAFLHLFFVADNCAVSDAFVCLTANQTVSFQASDLDPGTTGYLVVVAVDGAIGCATNFNYLIGDEYVKFTSGHAANLAAEAIAAIPGGLPACNAFSVTAQLNFDGISYNMLPTMLALDNIGSRADGNDTILVINPVGGDLRVTPATLGALFGVLYDDQEGATSFTLSTGACQLRTQINNNTPRTTPRFDQVVPAGRTGWIRINHRNNQAILGAAINFNPNAAATAGSFTGGHNLHKLTLTPTAVITVPVFPPSC